MVNINKIVKYNLQDEVLDLNRVGFSRSNIAKEIKIRHTDIQELHNLSAMSIQRFLESVKVQEKKEKYDKGEDPIQDLKNEFRDRMYTLDDETHDIYKIMKTALKNIVDTGDDYKVIKSARDALNAIEQTRKNWSTLIQWGVNEFQPIEKAKEINIIEINNLLVNVSKELCPNCRSKIVGLVLAEEEK